MSQDLVVAESLADLRNINIKALKASELGLNLLLLKIAQREAQRIVRLTSVIDTLENTIFDPTIIEHLSPQEQIQRYQLALQSTQQSSAYIKSAVTSINWGDIETRMLILEQESAQSDQADGISSSIGSPASSGDLQAAALKLLQQLSIETNSNKS